MEKGRGERQKDRWTDKQTEKWRSSECTDEAVCGAQTHYRFSPDTTSKTCVAQLHPVANSFLSGLNPVVHTALSCSNVCTSSILTLGSPSCMLPTIQSHFESSAPTDGVLGTDTDTDTGVDAGADTDTDGADEGSDASSSDAGEVGDDGANDGAGADTVGAGNTVLPSLPSASPVLAAALSPCCRRCFSSRYSTSARRSAACSSYCRRSFTYWLLTSFTDSASRSSSSSCAFAAEPCGGGVRWQEKD